MLEKVANAILIVAMFAGITLLAIITSGIAVGMFEALW